MEPLRRTAEVKLLGYGDEIPKVPKLDCRCRELHVPVYFLM